MFGFGVVHTFWFGLVTHGLFVGLAVVHHGLGVVPVGQPGTVGLWVGLGVVHHGLGVVAVGQAVGTGRAIGGRKMNI